MKACFLLPVLSAAACVKISGAANCAAVESDNTSCEAFALAKMEVEKNTIGNNYWIMYGKCLLLADLIRRTECQSAAEEDYHKGIASIRHQYEDLLKLCCNSGK